MANLTPAQRLEKSGYTTRNVVDRIVRTYHAADEDTVSAGLAWYGDALDYALTLADDFDADVETTAAVIAALSPQLMWGPNKVAARLAMQGKKKAGILGRSYDHARKVMASADPVSVLLNAKGQSRKVHNFARNILGDYDAVTVDAWAIRAALGPRCDNPELVLRREGIYDAVADCYRAAARRIGLSPAAVQAIVWCHVRGRAD